MPSGPETGLEPEGAEAFVAKDSRELAKEGNTLLQSTNEVSKDGEQNLQPEQLSPAEKLKVQERLSLLKKFLENPVKYFANSKVVLGFALAASLFFTGCKEAGLENTLTPNVRTESRLSKQVEHSMNGAQVTLQELTVDMRNGVHEMGLFGDQARRGENFAYLDNSKPEKNDFIKIVYTSREPVLKAEELYLTAMLDLRDQLKKQGAALVAPPLSPLDDRNFDHRTQYVNPTTPNPVLRGSGFQIKQDGNDRFVLETDKTEVANGMLKRNEFRANLDVAGYRKGDKIEIAPHDLSSAELLAIGYELAKQNSNQDWMVAGEKNPTDGTYQYTIDLPKLRRAVEGFLGSIQQNGNEKAEMSIAIAQGARK